MNSHIFNACLLLGWVLIVLGVAGLHSWAAAALAGGVLLMAVTLLLARWAGVSQRKKKGSHVPE